MNSIENFPSLPKESKAIIENKINRRQFISDLTKTILAFAIGTSGIEKVFGEEIPSPENPYDNPEQSFEETNTSPKNVIETDNIENINLIPGLKLKSYGLSLSFSIDPTTKEEFSILGLSPYSDSPIHHAHYKNNFEVIHFGTPDSSDIGIQINSKTNQGIMHFAFLDGSIRKNNSQYQSTIQIYRPDHSDQKYTTINFRQKPIITTNLENDIIIASDHSEVAPDEQVQQSFQKILPIVEKTNQFIKYLKKISPQDNQNTINEILFWQPLEANNLSIGYSAIREAGVLQGLNIHFDQQDSLLSIVHHECNHFIFYALSPENKKIVEKAYDQFIKLAGYANYQQFQQTKHATKEINPIFQIIDESNFLESRDAAYFNHAGHPYDNAHEMFASLLNGIQNKPDTIINSIGTLPPELGQIFREEIIKPVLSVFPPEFANELIGPAYQKLK